MQQDPSHNMSGRLNTPAPCVSIGMPAYNSELYISFALDSLLAQTYRDFEIVISDNGSTDGTEEICREYVERDERIRYFREEVNRGLSWNFNRTFELSRGKFFKWAATDDICDPTFLSRCMDILNKDKSVVCCHTKTMKIDGSGSQLTELPDPTSVGTGLRKRNRDGSSHQIYCRFLDVLLSSGWGVRSYGLIRTDNLRRTRLIRSCYGWEKVLMAELSLMGRFYDVPKVLFFQRVHAGASSSSLVSAAEQQKFVDPTSADHSTHPRLRLLQGHLSAVCRFPLSFYTRLLCFACIARYLFQVTKWKRCVVSLYRGTGTGASAKL